MGWGGGIDLNALMYGDGLRPKTATFLKFLQLDMADNRVGDEFSFVMKIIGTTGAGKSAWWSMIIELLCRNNPERWVAFWRASPIFIDALNERVPNYLKGRFTSIDHVLEIDDMKGFSRKGCIFISDEGDMDMNAKRALTDEALSLENLARKSRHNKIIMLIASQTGGFLKQIRMLVHFRIYKQIGQDYVHEADDWFAKKHAWDLYQLPIERAYLVSNYKYFTTKIDYLLNTVRRRNNKGQILEEPELDYKKMGKKILQGKIDMPLGEYATWFDSEISQFYSKESIDHEYELKKRREVELMELAEELFKFMGDDLFRPKAQLLSIRWLKANFPKKAHMFEKQLKEVYHQACYMWFKQKRKDDADKKEANASESTIDPKVIAIKGMSFADFLLKYYTTIGNELLGNICHRIHSGYTQTQIAQQLGIADGTVNAEFKEPRENNQMGNLAEVWAGKEFGLEIYGGNKSVIDGWHIQTGNIVTIKWRYDGKSRAEKKWIFENDMNPAFQLAKKLGIPFYILQIYPQWKANQIKIVKCDPQKEGWKIINPKTPSVNLDEEPKVEKLLEIYKNEGREGIQRISEEAVAQT